MAERFKQLWKNYHDNHSEWLQDYKSSYLFTIRLDTLFIVNNLSGDSSGIAITGNFVEDLGDSIKLRESFLRDLIRDVEKRLALPKTDHTLQDIISPLPEPEQKSGEPTKQVSHYPTFTAGTARQFYRILKDYFVTEDHSRLENLLLSDDTPATPLVFRGNANQLADAFKQLYDARMIVGCRMSDLEKWIAPKFMYLNNQSEPRELPEGYLSGFMSENTRPCKSPI